MNSKLGQIPAGASAVPPGTWGSWLTDLHRQRSSAARFPRLENMPIHNEDGVSNMHTYAAVDEASRGQSRQSSASRAVITWPGAADAPCPALGAASSGLIGNVYGTKLKAEARRYFGSFVSISARGEMIPNENCYHGTRSRRRKTNGASRSRASTFRMERLRDQTNRPRPAGFRGHDRSRRRQSLRAHRRKTAPKPMTRLAAA